MVELKWQTAAEGMLTRHGDRRYGHWSRMHPQHHLEPDPDPGHSYRYSPMKWHWLVFR